MEQREGGAAAASCRCWGVSFADDGRSPPCTSRQRKREWGREEGGERERRGRERDGEERGRERRQAGRGK